MEVGMTANWQTVSEEVERQYGQAKNANYAPQKQEWMI